MKRVVIQIRLTEDLKSKISCRAQSTSQTVSDYFRRIAEDDIKRNSPDRDLIKEALDTGECSSYRFSGTDPKTQKPVYVLER